MDETLNRARAVLAADPRLAAVTIREEQGEFHLTYGDDCFARLIPEAQPQVWRVECFRNLESWECLDFRGTLEECLSFLSENPHYLFWEG